MLQRHGSSRHRRVTSSTDRDPRHASGERSPRWRASESAWCQRSGSTCHRRQCRLRVYDPTNVSVTTWLYTTGCRTFVGARLHAGGSLITLFDFTRLSAARYRSLLKNPSRSSTGLFTMMPWDGTVASVLYRQLVLHELVPGSSQDGHASAPISGLGRGVRGDRRNCNVVDSALRIQRHAAGTVHKQHSRQTSCQHFHAFVQHRFVSFCRRLESKQHNGCIRRCLLDHFKWRPL